MTSGLLKGYWVNGLVRGIKMISKTKIKSRRRGKTNPELAETINLATKNPNWLEIAKVLSASTRKQPAINLSNIDKNAVLGDTIIIPGKVLSQGELTKRIKICSFSVSKQAKEKIKSAKSEFAYLIEEIKNNPKAEGIKIVK